MQQMLQAHVRDTLRGVRSVHDLNRLVDAAPINVQRKGSMLRAVIRLPTASGRVVTFVATVNLAAPNEMGWFGSSWVRKAKKKIGHTFPRLTAATKAVVKFGKRCVKSKVLQSVWKTMPLWANFIPPPAGTALAAGAAAAQAGLAIAAKAKAGSKAAIAFIDGAKQVAKETKDVVTAIKKSNGKPTPALVARARAVAAKRAHARSSFGKIAIAARKQRVAALARVEASVASRTKAAAAKAAKDKAALAKLGPVFTVRTPRGKVIHVPAKRVAA